MKWMLRGLFCAAAAAATVVAQGTGGEATGSQTFVDMAAQTDMTEAHLGQMAADQSSSSAVKDYAQMLVTDHTADYKQLGMVATKANLTLPKGLDAEHEKMIAPFEKLKGAAFDRKYIHTMMEGHAKAISAYTKESEDSQNADLQAYAKATLPTLEKHEAGAKDLMKGKK